MSELASNLLWPLDGAGDALSALAQARRISPRAAPAMDTDTNASIDVLAAALGIEAEPIEARYGDIEALLAQAEGAILRVTVGIENGLILIVKGGRRRARTRGRATVSVRATAKAAEWSRSTRT